MPYVKHALEIAFALTVLVTSMQHLSIVTSARPTTMVQLGRMPIYTKLMSIIHFFAFILVLLVFLVIYAVQSAVPILTFDTDKSDLPFVTASFKADEPDRKLLRLLGAALGVMALHWMCTELIQQLKECWQKRNPPCANCGLNPKVRYARRDEEKTAEY